MGPVGVHLDHAPGAALERHAEPVDVGLAQALLARPVVHPDARLVGRHPVGHLAGAIGRGIVDDEQGGAGQALQDGRGDAGQVVRLVVGRQDHPGVGVGGVGHDVQCTGRTAEGPAPADRGRAGWRSGARAVAPMRGRPGGGYWSLPLTTISWVPPAVSVEVMVIVMGPVAPDLRLPARGEPGRAVAWSGRGGRRSRPGCLTVMIGPAVDRLRGQDRATFWLCPTLTVRSALKLERRQADQVSVAVGARGRGRGDDRGVRALRQRLAVIVETVPVPARPGRREGPRRSCRGAPRRPPR